MGRYDGEDYADESAYASRAMQEAVRRGAEPTDGYPGYPESKMYPVCKRCTYRHAAREGCKGEVGRSDHEELVRQPQERQRQQELADAKSLLESAGYTVRRQR